MEDRKARKPHRCSLCFKEIKKGDVYKYRRVAPWEAIDLDFFYSYKAHPECDESWNAISNDYDNFLPLDGDEWQAMIEDLQPQTGKGKG